MKPITTIAVAGLVAVVMAAPVEATLEYLMEINKEMQNEKKHVFNLMVALVVMTSLVITAWAQPPRMKMTTDIPKSITIPNEVKTRHGPEQAWFDKTWRPSEIELVD